MFIGFLEPQVRLDQLMSQPSESRVLSVCKRLAESLGFQVVLTGSPDEIKGLLDRTVSVLNKKGSTNSTEFQQLIAAVKAGALKVNPSVRDKDIIKLVKQLIEQLPPKLLTKERQVAVLKDIESKFKLGFIAEHARQLTTAAVVVGIAALVLSVYAMTSDSSKGDSLSDVPWSRVSNREVPLTAVPMMSNSSRVDYCNFVLWSRGSNREDPLTAVPVAPNSIRGNFLRDVKVDSTGGKRSEFSLDEWLPWEGRNLSEKMLFLLLGGMPFIIMQRKHKSQLQRALGINDSKWKNRMAVLGRKDQIDGPEKRERILMIVRECLARYAIREQFNTKDKTTELSSPSTRPTSLDGIGTGIDENKEPGTVAKTLRLPGVS